VRREVVCSSTGSSVGDEDLLDVVGATTGELSRIVCLAIAKNECSGSDIVGELSRD
jgi:hypothetical protein